MDSSHVFKQYPVNTTSDISMLFHFVDIANILEGNWITDAVEPISLFISSISTCSELCRVAADAQ